jgi:membrane associated rhomboid family serine protease
MREYRNPNPIGVLILILVNVVVFILTQLEPHYVIDPSHIQSWHLGMLPETLASQPWTIVTSLFVHGSLWHILGNMITLYFFGTYLTALVGEKKFLMTYFLGGLLGNAFYLLYAFYTPWGDTYAYAIGASGAVFAVGGALVVLSPNVKTLVYFVVPVPLWVFVLGSFLLTAFIQGVAWQAHLGGLVVGLIAGFLFRRPTRPRDRYLL